MSYKPRNIKKIPDETFEKRSRGFFCAPIFGGGESSRRKEESKMLAQKVVYD